MTEAMTPSALFTTGQLLTATGGRLLKGTTETAVQSVNTDSRVSAAGSVFFAIKGERFDGARFCRSAVENGASALVVEQTAWDDGLVGDLPEPVAVIGVSNAVTALGELAAWHRRRFATRLIAVTGSNGKTTTKEMTAAVLGGEPQVLYNKGNFNNLIGLPLSLLQLGAAHHHAVMEMGMNAPGEIARLARIAGPQVGLITNVHPVHLEGLGSIEAVAEAKGELAETLPDDGLLIYNADDPHVLRQVGRTRARRLGFGHGPMADVRFSDVQQFPDRLQLKVHAQGHAVDVAVARPGAHNAFNVAAAMAVGLSEGLKPEQMADRLSRTEWPPMRLEHVDLGRGHLLVDCYNANPRSVQAGLDTLRAIAKGGRRWAVLGDMLELGGASGDLHHQTGLAASGAGLDGLCAFGPQSVAIAAGAREGGLKDVFHTEDIDSAVRWLRERLEPAAWALIKGSRAMRLERIARALADEAGVEFGVQNARANRG